MSDTGDALSIGELIAEQPVADCEFIVECGDFSTLQINPIEGQRYHYFTDSSTGRLIKDFVLRDGRFVRTLMEVTLVEKDGIFSPRVRLWKRKKGTGKRETLKEQASVLRDVEVSASVDTGDCYKQFWTVIEYLQSLSNVEVDAVPLGVAGVEEARLISLIKSSDRNSAVAAIETVLGGSLTESEVRRLSNCKQQLDEFRRLLDDDEYFASRVALAEITREEQLWQEFFERNQWIFGHGLSLVACERYSDEKLEAATTGRSVFGGAGKRVDALMRTRGFMGSLLFAEIKTHRSELLYQTTYRPPDVYRPSEDLTGGIAQIQKTAYKAVSKLDEIYRGRLPGGQPLPEVGTLRPRQILVLGNLRQFEVGDGDVNVEMYSTFELFRRSIVDTEIVTFDELYERARFIVNDK